MKLKKWISRMICISLSLMFVLTSCGNSIKEGLIEEFSTNGEAILRTQYDITDEDFNRIMESIVEEVRTNIRGYYWLGVIHISK